MPLHIVSGGVLITESVVSFQDTGNCVAFKCVHEIRRYHIGFEMAVLVKISPFIAMVSRSLNLVNEIIEVYGTSYPHVTNSCSFTFQEEDRVLYDGTCSEAKIVDEHEWWNHKR